MKELKRVLAVALMALALCGSALMDTTAFGQKNNDNRPKKEPQQIKEPPKPPPSSNNNSNRKGHN